MLNTKRMEVHRRRKDNLVARFLRSSRLSGLG